MHQLDVRQIVMFSFDLSSTIFTREFWLHATFVRQVLLQMSLLFVGSCTVGTFKRADHYGVIKANRRADTCNTININFSKNTKTYCMIGTKNRDIFQTTSKTTLVKITTVGIKETKMKLTQLLN